MAKTFTLPPGPYRSVPDGSIIFIEPEPREDHFGRTHRASIQSSELPAEIKRKLDAADPNVLTELAGIYDQPIYIKPRVVCAINASFKTVDADGNDIH